MATWPEAYAGKNPWILARQMRLKGGVRIATLAGAETWDGTSAQVGFLDCGGAGRTITLPAEETNGGLFFVIVNTSDAAEDITVNNDAAGGVITISQNEAGIVACDGSAWDGFIITGSLS